MADCYFYEMGSIAQLIQWGNHPQCKRTAVFCEHGIIASVMGHPISDYEDLYDFYTEKYDSPNFDHLTLTIEAYEPNPPYAKKTFRLAIDKERGGLIAQRRAKVASEEQQAREIEIRKSLQIQLAMKKKVWAEERASREVERLDELARKKAKQKRKITLIQEAQDLYLPQLALVNKEDPLYALSLFKFIFDHHPYLLTNQQRSTLYSISCLDRNIILQSCPANEKHPSAVSRLERAGVEITKLNSYPHYVSILEGEYIFRKHMEGQTVYIPIDNPSIIVDYLLNKASYSYIGFEEVFKLSLTGPGTYEGDENPFLSKPPAERYKKPVKIAYRRYKQFSYPKQSRRTLVGMSGKLFGGAVVAVATVGLSVKAMGMDWGEIVEESTQPVSDKKHQIKLSNERDVKRNAEGLIVSKRKDYRASNGKTYTIVLHQNTGKEILTIKSDGWRFAHSPVDQRPPGADYYKVCKTENELISYIEECISKSK